MKALLKMMALTGLAVVVGMVGQAGAAPITLFNTGVDAAGTTVLANGASELHYSLTSGPITGTPLVRAAGGTFPQPPWIAVNATSAWIVPNVALPLNHPPGAYTNEIIFDLAGLIPSSATITGQWATDNNATMFLNSVNTGNTTPFAGFGAFTAFSINSGFVAGLNVLEFVVLNAAGGTGNPTGLRVELSGTADVVPEPSTILLLGSGLAGLVAWRMKKAKA